MCNLVVVNGPHLFWHQVTAPSGTLGRVEPSATHSAVPQLLGGVYSLGGCIESHPIPLPSLHDREGSSFPGLVPSDDAVDSDSVMGINLVILVW